MSKTNFRIIIIDDDPASHREFNKILTPADDSKKQNIKNITFKIDIAVEGPKAVELIKKSLQQNKPYAIAFIDARIPPGWNGIETIKKILEIDKNIQIVINTSYSDYTWKKIIKQFQNSDGFLILKKPFDPLEVKQLVYVLTKKWLLKQEVLNQLTQLQTLITEHTTDLQKSFSLTKSTLDSTQEGILAVSRDKKILTHNKIFKDLWGISEEIIQSEKADIIFKQLAAQVEEYELFLKTMLELCEKPAIESANEWKLKTGNIVESHTHPQFLNEQIIGTVFSFQDITDRKTLTEQLLYQTTHDPLTGLANHTLLVESIQRMIIRAKRDKLNIGVLSFGIDNFQKMNDSVGHNGGNLILKEIAKRLIKIPLEHSIIARLGGDEFICAVASKHSEDYFVALANKYQKTISEIIKIDHNTIAPSVCIGISIYPNHGQTVDTLLKNAVAALHVAKEEGQDNWRVYHSEFNKNISRKVALENALRTAVINKEFILHYQPMLELNGDKIIAVEALVRWKHPTLGILYPNDFLPLAEDTGLIVEIDNIVLHRACSQIQTWLNMGIPPLRVAINISSQHFSKNNFVENIEKLLDKTKLNSELLELELTESAILGNPKKIIHKMIELKNMGIHLVMDNFGMGCASLDYLKQFPFEKIKIDKNFIQRVNKQNEDAAIVKAVITTAKKMGLQVVAEGVETYGQLSFLRTNASDQVQGYIISKPLATEQLEKLLKSPTKISLI